MKPSNFFQDHLGKASSMRLNTFILLLIACFVIIWQVMHNEIDHTLVVELLAIIFGAKAWQNRDELKRKQENVEAKKEQ